ncbi:uncharacterized protein BCR38DRAFT_474443 [Pseudomassariella vexata]|uniref:Cytochrome P450 n=1 Tax=Pseudomassariella vexata TaxID=1141098 RepID=A0A1Y2DXC2_9PEZI|nr:uncharacterized protein BCR38DRAFT_474443 [Pseudomassariella vexata]ORY63849.1 hypothetical protein BCR38DRAFT_474443 [Pseudomassariella vexata]
MHFRQILSSVALLAVGASAAPQNKRDVETNVTIYAWGTGLSGLPVFAGTDGIAYMAASPPANLSALTWDIDITGTAPWNVTMAENSTSSSVNTTNSRSFFIVSSSDAYAPCGFVPKNGSMPEGGQTAGFIKWGSDVMVKNGSTYTSQFWAQSTSDEGIWSLMWNSDGSSQDNAIPVLLKTTAPVDTTS